MGKRIIAVTDVHGKYLKLRFLLKKCKFDYKKDIFVFGGDLIDKGNMAWEIMDYFLFLEEKMKERFIWLQGNHEEMLVEDMEMGLDMDKTRQRIANIIKKHELPLMYETDKCIFVHAGYEKGNDNRWMFLEDRSVISGQRQYDGKLYLAGHSVVEYPLYICNQERRKLLNGELLPEKGAIFYDTGCCYGGKLTALIIDDNKIYIKQV